MGRVQIQKMIDFGPSSTYIVCYYIVNFSSFSSIVYYVGNKMRIIGFLKISNRIKDMYLALSRPYCCKKSIEVMK